MSRPNPLKEKSFAFAIRIVNAYKYLVSEKREFVMSKQLLRSGTAVGALYREAEQAESKADFVHKLGIAQKECNETLYWLELLHASSFLTTHEFEGLHTDATELIKLITRIILSSKNNQSTKQ